MNTRRQLAAVLAVCLGGLLIVSGVAVAVVAVIRQEIIGLSERTSPLQVNLANLQRGFERVSGNFARLGAAASLEEVRAVEQDTGQTLSQVEATAADLARMQILSGRGTVKKIQDIHGQLKAIARERLEARSRIAQSSQRVAQEIENVAALTSRLSQNMAALQRGSQDVLRQSKKTTQDANTSIKAMLVLRERSEQLRSLIQEARLVDKKYHLNVLRDKATAIVDSMAAQAVSDKDMAAAIAGFTAAFTPAFQGESGLLQARAAVLAKPQDAKLAAVFEQNVKSLTQSVDALCSRLFEAIDPLELAVRNANTGMNEATDLIAEVSTIVAATSEVYARSLSMQALAGQLANASSIADVDTLQQSVDGQHQALGQRLAEMRSGLAGLKRTPDVQSVDACGRALGQIQREIAGMNTVLKQGIGKHIEAQRLFSDALRSVQAIAREGGNQARDAENAQAQTVARIERLSTGVFFTISTLALVILVAGALVGNRVRGAILRTERQLAANAASMQDIILKVIENNASLRAASRNLSETSGLVTQNVQTMAAESQQMNSSIETIEQHVTQAVTVGGVAANLAGDAAAAVSRLDQTIQQIRRVTGSIRDISFRTRLLALNATIEAAHAGDAGRGFGVVADEVRKLAALTDSFTAEIDASTLGVQNEATGVGHSIGEIQSIIGRIKKMQGGIAAAVQQQTSTTHQLTASIRETAVCCSGSESRAGVNELSRKLERMAKELDEVCRTG